LLKLKSSEDLLRAYVTKDTKAAYGVHLRREANKFLQDKGAITTLFEEIAPKVLDRPGGYTRVLKMGRRLGDAAEIALIELVDYNMEQADNKGKDKAAEGETKKETKKPAKKTKKPAVKEASAKPVKKKKAKTEAK
jgi:large subunit ribosomal protein L17